MSKNEPEKQNPKNKIKDESKSDFIKNNEKKVDHKTASEDSKADHIHKRDHERLNSNP